MCKRFTTIEAPVSPASVRLSPQGTKITGSFIVFNVTIIVIVYYNVFINGAWVEPKGRPRVGEENNSFTYAHFPRLSRSIPNFPRFLYKSKAILDLFSMILFSNFPRIHIQAQVWPASIFSCSVTLSLRLMQEIVWRIFVKPMKVYQQNAHTSLQQP